MSGFPFIGSRAKAASFSDMCRKYGLDEEMYSRLERDIVDCSPLIVESAEKDSRVRASAFSSEDIVLEDAVVGDGRLRKAVFSIISHGKNQKIRGAIIYEYDGTGKNLRRDDLGRKTAILSLRGKLSDCVIVAQQSENIAGHSKNGFGVGDVIHGESATDYLRSRLPFYTERLAKREKQKLAMGAAVVFALIVIVFSVWYLYSGRSAQGDIPQITGIVLT